MTWAMERKAPRKAYLELLDQPATIMFNVFKDETIKTYKIPIFISATTTSLLKGMTNQALKLNISKIRGPPKKSTEEAFCGTGFSFNISFSASANGCKIPRNPVQFGPFRFCILAKTLRSKRVKNATVSITFNIKYKDKSIK